MLAFIIIVGIALLAILVLASGKNDKNAGSPAEQHAKAHGQPAKPAEPKKSYRELMRNAELLSLAVDLNIVEACNAAAPDNMPAFIEDYISTHFVVTKVAGINYRIKAAKPYFPKCYCCLVPEPKNLHDPNAIRVMTVPDCTHIGYIPAEECEGLLNVYGDTLPRLECLLKMTECHDTDDDHLYYLTDLYIPEPCNTENEENA